MQPTTHSEQPWRRHVYGPRSASTDMQLCLEFACVHNTCNNVASADISDTDAAATSTYLFAWLGSYRTDEPAAQNLHGAPDMRWLATGCKATPGPILEMVVPFTATDACFTRWITTRMCLTGFGRWHSAALGASCVARAGNVCCGKEAGSACSGACTSAPFIASNLAV